MNAGTSTQNPRASCARCVTRGFTLLEVLVALVIVALGMSALLAALSASASNIAALREKTLAEWIAMNEIANTRLSLTLPAIGTTEGDVRNCGNGNWHWQQQIAAVDEIPGLLSITVSVQRTGDASSAASSGGSGSSGSPATATPSLGPVNPLGAAGAIGATGCINSTGPGSSLGATRPLGATNSLGIPNTLAGPDASAPGGSNPANSGSAGSQSSASDKTAYWLATLTGFRGNSLGAASGESPDWGGSTFAGSGGTNGIPNGTNGGGVQGPLVPPNGSPPTTPQNRGVIGL